MWTREATKKRVVMDGGGKEGRSEEEVESVESAADYQKVMRETWQVVGRVMDAIKKSMDVRDIRKMIRSELDKSIKR
jgi:hypothetical protein